MVLKIVQFIKNSGYRADIRKSEQILKRVRNSEVFPELQNWILKNQTHPSWEVRNNWIKIIGELKSGDFNRYLIDLLLDRSQIGFIRRNAAISLSRTLSTCSDILPELIKALNDPYWEVRSHTALLYGHIGSPNEKMENIFITKIFKKPISQINQYPIWFPSRIYREKNFEVRAAYATALGSAITKASSLSAFEIMLKDDYWQVREASLINLASAANRLGIRNNELRLKFSDIDLTCPDFFPVFPIRKTWNEISTNLNNNNIIDRENN